MAQKAAGEGKNSFHFAVLDLEMFGCLSPSEKWPFMQMVQQIISKLPFCCDPLKTDPIRKILGILFDLPVGLVYGPLYGPHPTSRVLNIRPLAVQQLGALSVKV